MLRRGFPIVCVCVLLGAAVMGAWWITTAYGDNRRTYYNTTCRFENNMPAVACTRPGVPCTTCDKNHGGKLALKWASGDDPPEKRGWQYAQTLDCGNEVSGICDQALNCSPPYVVTGQCANPIIVATRQSSP